MKKLWCPLAFNGIVVKTDGRYRSCCASSKDAVNNGQQITRQTHNVDQAFTSDFFKGIRLNLENGIKDDNCNRCWEEEDLGIQSYRLKQIDKFKNNLDENDKLQIVDLALSNQCNLKCRICQPNDSTTWIKEFYDIDIKDKTISFREYQKSKTFYEHTDSSFINNLKENIKNIKHMSFYGGEPFLIKSTWDLLTYAVEHNFSKDIELVFNTNGTVWDDEKENLLSNFKQVELHLSIDGIGVRFEYLRHPAQWKTVYDNIIRIIKWRDAIPLSRHVIIDCSVSTLNVWYVPELVVFCKNYNLDIYINIVLEPAHYAISNIPQQAKEEIIKHYDLALTEDQEIKKIYGYLSVSQDDSSWKNFMVDVTKRDQYRNEKFQNTFTEYYRMLFNNNLLDLS
jgi:MoaA/NifB/PqqE/SkfB family radical SAM enzyme